MTGIVISVDGRRFTVRGERGIDISVPLDFHGAQPRHFGAPPATAKPLQIGGFVGDTGQGGSCNCEVLTLVPHCNGTHSESIGHVISGDHSVAMLATDALIPSLLLSVPVQPAEASQETSEPGAAPGDRWVTAAAIGDAAARAGYEPQPGLVVRSLPNDERKRTRDYGQGDVPPYFTTEAVDLLVRWGVRHLLIDLPSLDRSHDQGRLTGHRRFWGLPPAGSPANGAQRPEATITEMIFVPDELPEGMYALSLQIAPFTTDAAPSRPLLFPLEPA